jgi:hypothetical protein
MRRVVLAVSMVLSVMLSIGAVDASSGHSGRQDRPRAIQERHVADRTASRSLSGTFLPKLTVNAPSRQDASALRLPASAFSPATIDPSFDRVESNSNADQDFFGPPNGHSKTYEALQRITGYYQRANWQPAGAADTAHFRYQGSTFTSTSAAQTAWNDGITTTKGSLPASAVSDCTSSAGMPCNEVVFVDTSTTTHYRYYYLQKNQCLAETEFDFSDALYNSVDAQLEQIGANVAGNAAAVLNSVCVPGGNPTPTTQPTNPPPTATPTSRPTPPPTTISFTLISVRVEKYGAKADWKQVKPLLKQIKIGNKVQLSIYFLVNSAPAGEPYTVHWTVTQGGRALLNQNFNKNKLDTSDPTGTYRDRVGPLTMKNAGSVQVLGKLTIGNRAKQSSTAFQVVTKSAPVAPPPPPASFSFDKLVAMDATGHVRSTFAVGQTVVVVATYTVRNVRTGAVLTGTVNGSYLVPVKGKFQTGGVFQDQIVATKSGIAVHRHTTVGGFAIATAIHVLVRITLGRGFHEKQVAIQVK